MRIGIPKEIKILEGRVALVPAACAELIVQGHQVLLESGAGQLSGYADSVYQAYGVQILPDAVTLYAEAELIVKVKEPQPEEWACLQRGHRLFCFLHLAAEPALTRALQDIGLTAIGFETVAVDGELPLLKPMSVIAGRLAVQNGAQLLQRPWGGKGMLLGGLSGAARGKVVILGAGAAGGAATQAAAALGAQVTVFDKRSDRLAAMYGLGPNVSTYYPYAETIHAETAGADLVVGAVLVPGARAPHVVRETDIRAMQSGSVVVDISVDQGGCMETTRPTSYADPVYTHAGVIHFAVTNMPAAVAMTASQALSATLLPYVAILADDHWEQHSELRKGINVRGGEIVYPALKG